MREKGIIIDAFDATNWKYFDTTKEIPIFYIFLRKFLFTRYIGGRIRCFFHTLLLLCISKDYDIVDVHFFADSYIPYLRRLRKPFKISVWGSDFYRAKLAVQDFKKMCYEKSVMIQVETEEVSQDLLHFDSNLAGKIRVCNFGVDIIDIIASPSFEERELVKNDLHTNKIIVTVGYNGSKGQQHGILFEALESLPIQYKERLFLYVPVTYGLTHEYKQDILKMLERVKIPYHLFEERLSDYDLAQLRKDTDIVLNAQITDTLCASLLQHLCAGSILIVGDWLPYNVYDRLKIKYFKASTNEFAKKIIYCIDHFDVLKDEAKTNKQKVLDFASWENVSMSQFNIYKELFSRINR